MTRDDDDDDNTYETIEILQPMIINRTLQVHIFLHFYSSSILVEVMDIVVDEDIHHVMD